jgi:molybdenum cofactor synthesis domain-containing protein
MTPKTAALIIIGNEILSGRTQDKNLQWLAEQLKARGIPLREARVIPDIEATIIATVNELRARYDYVFTTGGIGPTHDDITSESIAKAFGLGYTRHPEAEEILKQYYAPHEQTEARMKMANTPQGARLIPNAISAAPGFVVGNVYVMAGVPRIFQSLFLAIAHELDGGAPILSETVGANIREGDIAEPLAAIQSAYPDVEIGSYPYARQGTIGTQVVLSATNQERLQAAAAEVRKLMQNG